MSIMGRWRWCSDLGCAREWIFQLKAQESGGHVSVLMHVRGGALHSVEVDEVQKSFSISEWFLPSYICSPNSAHIRTSQMQERSESMLE